MKSILGSKSPTSKTQPRRTRSRKQSKQSIALPDRTTTGSAIVPDRFSWDRYDAGYQGAAAQYGRIIDILENLGLTIWSTHDGMATYVATATHVGRVALRRWPTDECDFCVTYRTGGIEAINLTSTPIAQCTTIILGEISNAVTDRVER